jgi:hypothetical protein
LASVAQANDDTPKSKPQFIQVAAISNPATMNFLD